MKDIESQIFKEIKDRCSKETNAYGIGAWDHHIKIVYEIAKENASEYGADKEIVAIAALLHDVASVTNKEFTNEHHKIGAEIAEDLLLKENYEREKIELVKNCILHHRGSIIMDKGTPEEICIADADAMAHFYNIPSLFSMVYREKQLSIDEGIEFVRNKLEKSYRKLSSKGKKIVEEQYKAAKILLR